MNVLITLSRKQFRWTFISRFSALVLDVCFSFGYTRYKVPVVHTFMNMNAFHSISYFHLTNGPLRGWDTRNIQQNKRKRRRWDDGNLIKHSTLSTSLQLAFQRAAFQTSSCSTNSSRLQSRLVIWTKTSSRGGMGAGLLAFVKPSPFLKMSFQHKSLSTTAAVILINAELAASDFHGISDNS